MADDKKDDATPPIPGAPGNGRRREKPPELVDVEFKIELGDDRNRNIAPAFITQGTLRGRWDWNNCRLMTIDSEDPIKSCPNIPGVYIQVSASKRQAKIYDPLKDIRNEELMEEIQKVIVRARGEKQGPMNDMIFDNLDETDLKTWCYWCRVLVDNRQTFLLAGEVPTIEDIKAMPGKIITAEYDRETNEQKMMDIPRRYRPTFEERPGDAPKKRQVVVV